MRDKPIIPIIFAVDMALGFGLVEESFPKQYLSLCTNGDKTLFTKTVERIIQ